jgi:hypothetical protein
VTASSTPPNKYFRLVIATGALFAFTAMCMFASALGHPLAPPNRFFNRYGIPLILVEAGALIASAVVALSVDRRQTLAEMSKTRPDETGGVTPRGEPESPN